MASAHGEPSLPPKMAHKRARGGGIGGSNDVAEDVELGDEPVVEQPLFLLFNLENARRPAYLYAEQWCVQAKARAEQIRFGNEHTISWWGSDSQTGRAILSNACGCNLTQACTLSRSMRLYVSCCAAS